MDPGSSRYHGSRLNLDEQDREARRDKRYEILDGVSGQRRPETERRRNSSDRDRESRRHDRPRHRNRSRDDHRRRRPRSPSPAADEEAHTTSERRPRRRRSRDRSREREHERRRPRSRSHSPRRPHKSSRRAPSRSRSRDRKRHRRSPSPESKGAGRSRQPLPSQEQSYHAETNPDEPPPIEKQQPNFGNSGLLAKEANRVEGTDVSLLHAEPPDARKPPSRDDWRVYVFKGEDLLDTVQLRDRSCWLIGREVQVVDLPAEHPSCSKQHAVLQFRYTTRTNDYGDKDSKVRLYLMDLNSSNGTLLNGDRVEGSRYVEVLNGDVVKFGTSEREYVVQLPPPEKK